MKTLILSILLTGLLISCDSGPDLSWAKGGTLHKAKVSQWRSADEHNKFATCADFAANVKSAKGEQYRSIAEMKADAAYLKSCIDEAAKPPTDSNQSIPEIATACLTLKK